MDITKGKSSDILCPTVSTRGLTLEVTSGTGSVHSERRTEKKCTKSQIFFNFFFLMIVRVFA